MAKKKIYEAPDLFVCEALPARMICVSGVGAVHDSQDDDYISPAKKHGWFDPDANFESVGRTAWDKLDDKLN